MALDTLPCELVHLLLNGAPNDGETCGPFLRPSVRFVVRAVCRQWHAIIGEPLRSDRERLIQHCPDPVRVKAWVEGRLVCCTALAFHFTRSHFCGDSAHLTHRMRSVREAYGPTVTWHRCILAASAFATRDQTVEQYEKKTLSTRIDGFLAIASCPPARARPLSSFKFKQEAPCCCCKHGRQSVYAHAAAACACIGLPQRALAIWPALDAGHLFDCALLAGARDHADAVEWFLRRALLALVGSAVCRAADPFKQKQGQQRAILRDSDTIRQLRDSTAVRMWHCVAYHDSPQAARRLLVLAGRMAPSKAGSGNTAGTISVVQCGRGVTRSCGHEADPTGGTDWRDMTAALYAAWRAGDWIDTAARRGSTRVFAAHAPAHHYDHIEAMHAAARHNRIDVCRWVARERHACCGFNHASMCRTACHAIAAGSLPVLDWLVDEWGFAPQAADIPCLLRRLASPGQSIGMPPPVYSFCPR